jgi:hypothetical protein
MDALKKMLLLVGAALLALTLVAGPALAAEDPAGGEEAPAEGGGGEEDEIVGEHGEAEGGKIQLVGSPRDAIALVFLGALLVGGGLAFANGRRQLRGERPAASGEFRWR